ncbi:uncharacterized protein K489DRAFT_116459 [Dissoconium aciculare CBS 342.82]|uniref:Uncharacterized protein n=1 Tax=Dissoconium aciculare CBS 342.82 TaxID=1314786 RepID=A0A6J3MF37_9PEZI|nr:uncharacterized protein K489DRAFT_116459 [Dissoconium aciculare CBS 342.82]KAF1826463.1 hypothetical protein K489DRAFT_116459 [Dissoconium aciculare CBS 342.82]
MAGWSGEGEKKERGNGKDSYDYTQARCTAHAHIYSNSQSIFASPSFIISARESSSFLCISLHLLAAEKRCSATLHGLSPPLLATGRTKAIPPSPPHNLSPSAFYSARQSYLLSAFVFTSDTIIPPGRHRVASSPPAGGYSAIERWERLFSTQLFCPQPARTCVADVADLEITPASN